MSEQYTNKMTSNIDVTGIGEKHLSGSFSIKVHDKAILCGQLVYQAKLDRIYCPGSVTVKRKDQAILAGTLKIRPQNRMIVSVEVVQPPIKKLDTEIIKDTGLYSTIPHINFGKDTVLALGNTSEEDINEIVLEAKVKNITQDEIDHLEVSKLIFKLLTAAEEEVTLKLYRNDLTWNEYGVNYENRPTTGICIMTYVVKKGDTEISIDLTEYVKQNINVGENIYNFKLRGSDKNLENTIMVGSRENLFYTPEFCIGAKFYPDSVGLKKLQGSLVVKQTDVHDLIGSLFLKTGIFANDLASSLTIKKYKENQYLKGSLIVKRTDIQDVCGSLSIIRYDDKKDMQGSVTVVQSDRLTMNGTLTILKNYRENDLSGSVTVVQTDRHYLSGSLRFVPIEVRKDLSGSLTVVQTANQCLAGTINYAAIGENEILKGSLIIKLNDQFDITGSLSMVPVNSEAIISGSLTIKQFISDDLKVSLNILAKNNYNSLDGSLLVKESHNEGFLGNMQVRETYGKILSGHLSVIPYEVEYVSGSVTIVNDFSYGERNLAGSFEILKQKDESILSGSMLVNAIADKTLNGNLIVKQVGNKILTGEVFVRQIWAKDISGTVVISNIKNNHCYVYII